MPSNFAVTPTSTTTLGSNQFPVSAVFVPGTASGNLTALQGGPASTDGNGYTSAPVAVYQATGTNLHTVVDSGTVTANQGGSWAVTANAGTNLNTSALALESGGNLASIATNTSDTVVNTQDIITTLQFLTLTQGSTTSGEKGPLVLGAVTTASPSYTTAQSSPLSLTTAGALRVDASATTQPVSGTFWQATQPVSGTVTANIGTTNGLALDATVGKLNVAQAASLGTNTGPMMQGSVTTSAPTYTTGQINPLSLTTAGALRVDGSGVTQPISGTVTANAGSGTFTVSGTVTANQSGTWTVQPGNTPNTTPWLTQSVVGTSGGSTSYHNVVSSGTNGTNAKGTAGQVYDGSISNTSASAVYFRFYDTASVPTVGTTTVKRTIQVPGNGTVIFSWPNGLKFTSGIAWGITASVADTDTTAISASVSIDFGYV